MHVVECTDGAVGQVQVYGDGLGLCWGAHVVMRRGGAGRSPARTYDLKRAAG